MSDLCLNYLGNIGTYIKCETWWNITAKYETACFKNLKKWLKAVFFK